MESRNTLIDELKGIAILLMLFGHILQFVFKVDIGGFVFATIYSFHMAFFMFLSGYSLSLGHKEFECKYVLRRMLSLFMPFVVWGVVYICIRDRNNPLDAMVTMFLYPDHKLWFLWVLSWITFFIYMGQILSNTLKSDIGFVLIVVITTILYGVTQFHYFGFDLIVIHYVFFLLGYKLDIIWKGRSVEYKSLIKIVAIILFGNLLIFWRFPSHFLIETPLFDYLELKKVPILIVSYERLVFYILAKYIIQIAGIISIIALYCFVKQYVFELLKKTLSFLGQRTLIIYTAHFMIVYDLPVLVNEYIDAVVKFVLGIGIPILIGYVLGLNKYISFVFLGKRFRKLI